MGGIDFTLALTIGAVLLAGWLDFRFGKSRPDSPTWRVAHAIAGVVVLQLSIAVLYWVDGEGTHRAGFMLAVVVIFLPALTYALLAGSWVMRTLAEIARLQRH